ncbi:hypothetical protein ACOME3_005184 [Neoechinorhynchus agilis]
MTIKKAIDCSCGQFKSLSVEERAKYEAKANNAKVQYYTGKHVAAEFALCKIGSKGKYECSIIDPGKIPTGCLADTKESEEVHHIPADMSELRELKGTGNYEKYVGSFEGRVHQGEPPDFKTVPRVPLKTLIIYCSHLGR